MTKDEAKAVLSLIQDVTVLSDSLAAAACIDMAISLPNGTLVTGKEKLEMEYAKHIDQLIKLKSMALRAIMNMDDLHHKAVLISYYFLNKKLDQIALAFGVTARPLIRHLNAALEEFAVQYERMQKEGGKSC